MAKKMPTGIPIKIPVSIKIVVIAAIVFILKLLSDGD